jgi:hypothetical protein
MPRFLQLPRSLDVGDGHSGSDRKAPDHPRSAMHYPRVENRHDCSRGNINFSTWLWFVEMMSH